MRTFCSLTAIAIVQLLSAQCKYERNEVDRFTHNHVVEVKAKVSFFGAMIDKASFRLVDGHYFMDIHSSTPSDFVVSEGSSLYFLLANDSVVIAKSIGLFSPSPKSMGSTIAWIFDGTYELDREAMAQLAAVPVVALRFYNSGAYTEREWKPSKQTKLMDAARCLLAATPQ
jgi:hypothetical protein